jgi:Uma2 family endonuclease
MTIASSPAVNTEPLLLDVSSTILTVTSEQFDRLCLDNPDLRLELTPNRPESSIEDLPLAIDCSEVMPGFVLSMDRIW